MKAIVVRNYGGPEVLEVTEVPEPVPGKGEVLLRQQYAGVNFIDTYQRSGIYRVQLPFVPGNEGIGIIEAVGDDVPSSMVGQRVAYAMLLGAYRELAVVPYDRVVPVPESLESASALASLLQGMTAKFLVTRCYQLHADQLAVVHAAAGGVGSLIVQLAARSIGARVIATASTEPKAAIARELGASYTYGYADFAAKARELGGADVVYDGVGQATFDDSLAALRARGMMVLYGASSGPVPPFDLQRLNSGGSLYITRPSLAHYTATREELLELSSQVFDHVSQGELKIRIGGVYSLTDVSRAHRELESRSTTGKLLIAF
jgi:NADPH2:quinone reductase